MARCGVPGVVRFEVNWTGFNPPIHSCITLPNLQWLSARELAAEPVPWRRANVRHVLNFVCHIRFLSVDGMGADKKMTASHTDVGDRLVHFWGLIFDL